MSKSARRVSTIKIFIADSSLVNCDSIAAQLRRVPQRVKVVGYATDADGIRAGIDASQPDVAIIGAHLEEGNGAGFTAARRLRASRSKPRVIMILDSSEASLVVEAFRAGASGIFCRYQSSGLLSKCIHLVHSGRVWASTEELRYLIDALGSSIPSKPIPDKRLGLLTKREQGVVHLVAEGFTNRDISEKLNLSQHTVRNYIFRIFNKVGTSNRVELALYAIDRREGDPQQTPVSRLA